MSRRKSVPIEVIRRFQAGPVDVDAVAIHPHTAAALSKPRAFVPPEWIPDGFTAKPHGAESLAIRCKHCSEGWAYPANKEPTAGTLLHLLNHARSHEAGR